MSLFVTKKTAAIIIVFFLFSFLANSALAVCSEPNASQYLVCEDWDTGTPPIITPTEACSSSIPNSCCPTGTWPGCNPNHNPACAIGTIWHNWIPGEYGTGECGEITNTSGASDTIKHSGRSSYLIRKRAHPSSVDGSTVDISIDIPSSPVVYIRFYIYIPSTNITGLGMQGGHFMFINSSVWAQLTLDFSHNGQVDTGGYCDSLGGPFLDVVSGADERTAYNMSGVCQGSPRLSSPPRTYFNWLDHTNEWVLIEWKLDMTSQLQSFWINGVQQVSNWPVAVPSWSSVYSIILSGFQNNANDYNIKYYIDDFVVSTSYIGPRQTSSDTTPPSPPTGISVS